MKANPHSIGNIFSQVLRFVVPLFQRPYVWNKDEHWTPLWHDIRTVAERLLVKKDARPHFLGAIVLEEVSIPTGHLETRRLIDGQQRLTTVQLFLEALCDYCAAAGVDDYHKALLQLTRNNHPLSKEPDQVYKVWPTFVDQDDFRRVMECLSPAELRKAYDADVDADEVGHRIADAYLFFFKVLTEWFVPAQELFKQRLDALLTAIHKYLRIVVIDLEQEDDPQLIFETLNARGTPLLPSDLIKNHLLQQATQEEENAEALYKKHWQPFDDNERYWRKQIGRGHAKRHRVDIFFQYYLSVRRGEEVAVGHLYSDFRDHVDKGKATAKTTLESVQKYAQVYRALDEPQAGTPNAVFLRRVKTMEYLTAIPFLMDLFVRYEDQPDEIRIVHHDIESFLVRRMVCNLNSRGYNRLFLELSKEITKGDGKPSDSVRQFLLSSEAESTRWPNDDEFKTAWLNTPIYRILRQQRVRMILEAMEHWLYDPKTEKIEFKDRLQVEHLMPRRWEKHWPLVEDADKAKAVAQRGVLLHTFGNLTLLTKKLNPVVSNGSWEKKQHQILEHTALKLNAKLKDFAEWNESRIVERGEALLAIAQKIWPRPAGAELHS